MGISADTAATLAVQSHNATVQAVATIGAAFFVALVGTIGAALITSRIQKARNIQDRESQWRQHAVELAKLEVDRQIRSRGRGYRGRPAILDFLAFYRDLQELNYTSPSELYRRIRAKRINTQPDKPIAVLSEEMTCVVSCSGDAQQGHQIVYLTVSPGVMATCPYCDQKFMRPIPIE